MIDFWKKWKKGKSILAGVLTLTMSISPLTVFAVNQNFTEDDIINNEYLLYLVNCGTPDSSIVPEGSSLGLYQSNVWQEYGEDSKTGLSWGYAADTEYSKIVSGGSNAASLTDNYIYTSESVKREDGKTGFTFTFELPERESDRYEVTVGMQNPWSGRNITVNLEGEAKGTLTSFYGSLDEGTYEVEVTDGELNVFINNPGNTSQYGDPVCSYVIVKAVPIADSASLKALIEKYETSVAGKTYSEDTLEAFNKVLAEAKETAENGSSTAEEIQDAMDELDAAYDALKQIYTYDSITGTNGEQLYDTNGNKIQAHGGQIQKWGDTYYWYGEDKTNGYRPVVGVHLYTSKDLYNWTDGGVVLKSIPVSDEEYGTDQDAGYVADLSVFEEDEYFRSLYSDYARMKADDTANYSSKLEEVYWNLAEDRSVIERPKVLYNEATGKYVMWYHADGRTPTSDADYGKARAGVAVSDSPNGPFKLVGTYLLATGTDDHSWDAEGGHVRDMNLFQDDDGNAYVLYSSEGNTTLYIARLNADYTGLVKNADEMVLGEDFNIISTDSREAPALFKYDSTYYLITSGCTGWAPNQARYTVATDLMGDWTNMGDPCVGDTAGTTFSTQSTCVFPVDAEAGKFIYMGDRWHNPDTGGDLSDSRYVWLPVEFGEGQALSLKSYADWTLDELDGKGKISINTKLPSEASSATDLLEKLPSTLDVTIGGTNYSDVAVTWAMDADKTALGEYVLGDVTVTATLTELNRSFEICVFIYSKDLVYFADCYTNGDNTSEIFDNFSSYSTMMRNTVSDQAYGDDHGYTWGYTSTPGASGGSSSEDMGSKGTGDFYDTGWWATSGSTIDYAFDVEPGNYVVATGHQEWWSTTRYQKITVTSVDSEDNETEIGNTSFTLASTDLDRQVNTIVEVPEDSDHIVVSVSKTSGSDPVLSWIGIISTDEKVVASDELLTDGSFEDQNASGVWNIGSGSTIVSGNAADGERYLKEDGKVTGWGTESGQEVSVEPDTEYVLKGSAKVDSGVYWVGAKVDGVEIYCAVAADPNYTDTTNESKKIAYSVAAGATEWTDFEVKFTTGPDTEKVNVYTWIGKDDCGYLDNVSLTKVLGTEGLDWSYFDEAVEAAEKLNESDYTAESWEEFQKVLNDAKAFKENADDTVTRKQILAKADELKEAMKDLIGINEPTGDQVYYVDSVNGDDSNDGLSEDTAWKTLTKASSIRELKEGGSILLKRGCVWNGEQLEVKNAVGTEENPIIIGSYGDENAADPVINGNGAKWEYSTKAELAAVHIYNSENIVIEDLEITNWDLTAGEVGSYAQSSKLLSGLVVENKDAGELSNVTIRNLKIHDVNGLMAGGSSKAAGGLIVVVTGSKNNKGTVESWYDGLTIEGNEVYNVCHEAIYMESVWASRTLVGGTSNDTGYQNAGDSAWVGSNNVLIENNYVHDVAGDGIVPINTTDALVQYNLIDNSADSNWNYSNNPNHAALWTWDSDNVTFRYNEVCNTSKDSQGTAVGNDSMAFDFDYGVQNCLYEYNYSHDNLGGFLMLCPGPGATVNNIARYNVSVNDGLYEGAPVLRLGTGKYGSIGVQIYNNTVYWADTGYSLALAQDSYWEGAAISDVSVFNNIFYGPATSDSVSTKDGVSYYNNCVYGGAEETYMAAANDENAIIADPMFVDTNDHTSGSWTGGQTTLGTVVGFMLQENSPCINAGADHPDAPNYSTTKLASELVENKTKKAAYDYYGVALSDEKNDIGANEYYKEVVDKTALEEMIKKAELVDEEEYTAESYAEMKTLLEKAIEVYENEDANQQDVEKAIKDLDAAMNSLVKKEEQKPENPDGTKDPEKDDSGNNTNTPGNNTNTAGNNESGANKGDKDTSGKKDSENVKTGDTTTVSTYIVIMLIAVVVLIVVVVRRKRK